MQILVGITGGIAAYKAANVVRLLTEYGHQVKALPTQNALRFIGSATLEALSHNAVDPDLYSQVEDVKHIKLAQEADLVIVAPATASFIARYANGIADDLLLNVLLATKAKVVIAPAMHSEMWEHPSTQENIAKLKLRSVYVIEPGVGRLTGQDSGVGRMAEPEEIVRLSLSLPTRDLTGKRFLIAAGGTREAIDDVRFIGNSSSGKQGIALAQSALDRGAEVTLIAANIDLPLPVRANIIQVVSASDLQEAIEVNVAKSDALLMPIAVSDYRVDNRRPGKIRREEGELNLELVPNPDIVANVARKYDDLFVVAFAAEVVDSQEELDKAAKVKLEAKGVDLVVANNVSSGKVFGSDQNEVSIVSKTGSKTAQGSKYEVAGVILDEVLRSLG